MQANQIDKVVLVGGATRTPLVHHLLEERLGRPVHCEIEPDLAVAMGAAVQGGLIAGIDVGPILVDITPHTLGISALGELHGFMSPHAFSPIIERNTPLPACRTEIYSTVDDDQDAAEIRVFQGENHDTRYNTLVGEFMIEGLAEVPAGNQILVRLDLDLNGILKVTATERATGLAKHVVIDNAMERFRKQQRSDAVDRLEAVMGTRRAAVRAARRIRRAARRCRRRRKRPTTRSLPRLREAIESAEALVAKAKRVLPEANAEDAEELRAMLADLDAADRAAGRADIRIDPPRGRGPGLLPGRRVSASSRVSHDDCRIDIIIDEITRVDSRCRCQSNGDEMRCPTCGARQGGPTPAGAARCDLRLLRAARRRPTTAPPAVPECARARPARGRPGNTRAAATSCCPAPSRTGCMAVCHLADANDGPTRCDWPRRRRAKSRQAARDGLAEPPLHSVRPCRRVDAPGVR